MKHGTNCALSVGRTRTKPTHRTQLNLEDKLSSKFEDVRYLIDTDQIVPGHSSENECQLGDISTGHLMNPITARNHRSRKIKHDLWIVRLCTWCTWCIAAELWNKRDGDNNTLAISCVVAPSRRVSPCHSSSHHSAMASCTSGTTICVHNAQSSSHYGDKFNNLYHRGNKDK